MSNLNSTKRILYIVFFLSGISGLIYETVWLRVLSRILGSTVQATSITISAFMLGLTLGSYYLSKASEKVKNKITLYAKLELGIAFTAIATYLLFNELVPIYRFFFDMSGDNMILFRFLQAVVLFVLMVIPTFFMGATLPVLSAGIMEHGSGFTKTVGFLYGLNTFGAMFGVFFSAFITLGSIGEFNTILVGCFFNLVAGTVFLLAGKKYQAQQDAVALEHKPEDIPSTVDFSEKTRKLVLITYCLIGFISFALEVVWVRLFQLSLGTAVYAFSSVMIVYLGGSALGSYTCSRYYSRLKAPVETLGLLLTGVGLYIIVGLFIFNLAIPWTEELHEFFYILIHSKLLITPLIVFPVTFVIGFIFPLVSRMYVNSKEHTGSGIGRLYAANTVGCILGALFCGYVFIPLIGTRNTMIFLSAAGWILGTVIVFAGGNVLSKTLKRVVVASSAALILLAVFIAPDPFLTNLQKFISGYKFGDIWYHKEASDATITVSGISKDNPSGKQLFINGNSMTALCVETKVMAHLPILLHPDPKNMLIICYGMGTCLRSAVTHPGLNIDVVELVKEEYEVGQYFHSNAREVLANKRVHHFADDGRNYLLMHDKKYDIITIDPAPPLYSAGTVNLYSKDFFAMCRQKMNPNGILCLWIQPDKATEVKMIMKSFQSVFPSTYVYDGPNYKGFYMVGYMNYTPPNVARFDSAAKDAGIMADLNEWNTKDTLKPVQLLKLNILSPSELATILQGVKEVSDNYPYTEFYLWRCYFSPEYSKTVDGSNIKTD
jgi:spermidine synthase